jgi:hypothetical protein
MWQEKTNLQYDVKLSITTTTEFLIGPHKLKTQEISIISGSFSCGIHRV